MKNSAVGSHPAWERQESLCAHNHHYLGVVYNSLLKEGVLSGLGSGGCFFPRSVKDIGWWSFGGRFVLTAAAFAATSALLPRYVHTTSLGVHLRKGGGWNWGIGCDWWKEGTWRGMAVDGRLKGMSVAGGSRLGVQITDIPFHVVSRQRNASRVIPLVSSYED